MLEKILAVFSLFRKGQEIDDAEKWKQGSINASLVSAFLLTLVATLNTFFGWHVQLDASTASVIATGLIALFGVVFPIITSARAGLLSAATVQPASTVDPGQSDPVPAVATPTATASRQPTSVQPVLQAADGSVIDNSWEQNYRG